MTTIHEAEVQLEIPEGEEFEDALLRLLVQLYDTAWEIHPRWGEIYLSCTFEVGPNEVPEEVVLLLLYDAGIGIGELVAQPTVFDLVET